MVSTSLGVSVSIIPQLPDMVGTCQHEQRDHMMIESGPGPENCQHICENKGTERTEALIPPILNPPRVERGWLVK